MATVTLTNVRKSFGELEIIQGVNLDIKDDEFVVFVGPSGCGKSTLLRLIAGLEDITSGDLMIDDKVVNDLPPSERGIAMVFQSYALYPHMTVEENISFGLRLAKESRESVEKKVADAARVLQLEHLLKRKPRELSGGQRQRVAIGRAIVRDPKVFLFDEPLSNLDASLRVQMRIEIARLHQELHATMIYVTHDQVEAMTLADKIVVLNSGRVEQFGSPMELYHHPANLFVAGFIGSPKMNFIETSVSDVTGAQATVRLPGGSSISVPVKTGQLRVDDKVTFGYRPEHMSEEGPADAYISGQVFVVERLGGESYFYLKTDEDNIIVVKAAGDSRVKVGDTINVGLHKTLCHLFDENGDAVEKTTRNAMADTTRREVPESV
ncbi:sn-glycerol-3-phosphate ABC transporter ATP-binding protein UgpC [Fodinicurvata sp. EGI_FJ10296]|uniref:ABC transporter ATP-binding protein n=1 Tax=Fodinicurvata sp. EGI_FJ10296 TaxID=3231908 RepID=UPI003452D393